MAVPCAVRAAAGWNGCWTVDHDHDVPGLRGAGRVVGDTCLADAARSEPARSGSACRRYRCNAWRGAATPETIMDLLRDHDHFAVV